MSDNDLTKNVNFLQKIDKTVKTIMKDGKIDQFDIPEIITMPNQIQAIIIADPKSGLTSTKAKKVKA